MEIYPLSYETLFFNAFESPDKTPSILDIARENLYDLPLASLQVKKAKINKLAPLAIKVTSLLQQLEKDNGDKKASLVHQIFHSIFSVKEAGETKFKEANKQLLAKRMRELTPVLKNLMLTLSKEIESNQDCTLFITAFLSHYTQCCGKPTNKEHLPSVKVLGPFLDSKNEEIQKFALETLVNLSYDNSSLAQEIGNTLLPFILEKSIAPPPKTDPFYFHFNFFDDTADFKSLLVNLSSLSPKFSRIIMQSPQFSTLIEKNLGVYTNFNKRYECQKLLDILSHIFSHLSPKEYSVLASDFLIDKLVDIAKESTNEKELALNLLKALSKVSEPVKAKILKTGLVKDLKNYKLFLSFRNTSSGFNIFYH